MYTKPFLAGRKLRTSKVALRHRLLKKDVG